METIFKVNQFGSSSLADELSVLCAKSNGADVTKKLFIDDLISYVRCQQIRYPAMNRDINIAILTGSHVIIEQDEKPIIEIMEANIYECPTLDHNNMPSAN